MNKILLAAFSWTFLLDTPFKMVKNICHITLTESRNEIFTSLVYFSKLSHEHFWPKILPFLEDSILFLPWFLIETIFLFEENRNNSKQKTSEIQIEIS